MRETLQLPSQAQRLLVQLLEEFEACDALQATKAKTNPNTAQLLTVLTQLHINGQPEEKVFPYPGTNTFYLSLCCSIHDVYQSIKITKQEKNNPLRGNKTMNRNRLRDAPDGAMIRQTESLK